MHNETGEKSDRNKPGDIWNWRYVSLTYRLVMIIYITCSKCSLPMVEAADPSLAECSGSFDLAILLDSSASLRDSDPFDRPLQTWKMVANFTSSFIQSLPTNKDIRFSVIKYSSNATVVYPMTSRQGFNDSPLQILNSLTFIGSNTDTSAALAQGKQILGEAQNSSRQLVLLITDGLSNVNSNQTIKKATELTGNGVELYVLGITKYMNTDELMGIASNPASKYFAQLIGPSQLNDVIATLLRRVCNLPDPSPAPPTPCTTIPGCKVCLADSRICEECNEGYFRNGWNCFVCPGNCQNCTSSTNCEVCKIGFYKDPVSVLCRACGKGLLDLVFLIDTSGSITDKNPKNQFNQTIVNNFDLIKQFVQRLVDSLPIGADNTRVGLLTFSDKASSYFYLNTSFNRVVISDAIDKTPYARSDTNTSGALRVLRTDAFTPEHGDRAGVPNVGIMVTDGIPTVDQNLTIPEAQKCREANIRLFSVGVTNDIDLQTLNNIAWEPSDKYVFYSDYIISLTDVVLQKLTETLCNGI